MKRSLVLLTLFATACATAKTPAPTPQRGPAAGPGAARTPTGAPGARPGGATPGTPGAAPGATQTGGAQTGGPGGPGGGGAQEPNPRPYASVVTPSAVTRAGLFKTHRVGSRLLFEIPRAEMGKEMLLVTTASQVTDEGGDERWGGAAVGNRVLRWERRDNRVVLRSVSYQLTADTALPIYRAVQASNLAPVVAVFNVEAYGPDSAAVIDVTRLYTTSSPEFGIGGLIRGTLDPQRSFVERTAAFPTNVEVEAMHTYTVTPTAPPGIPEQFRPLPQTVGAVLHWSMVRLPDEPMRPRLADNRVGYFTVSQRDYGRPEHGAAVRRYITRWRLEKKDPSAAMSEPVKPITFYIDPATPQYYREFVRRGIEAWQPAFESAGFRRAIVAADAPNDPDWSPEDARYSVIRWLPTTVFNASGPHVHDPRTGEILEADIQVHHAYMEGVRDQYFYHVAPLDPRAQRLPFPDSLIGRLVQQVVTHEVGHSLGFPHNMKASSQFPVDSLRSPAFLARWGHTPSIMDYSRFNYVAQPEDRIPVEDLIRKVGPYDHFAVAWGYRPLPQAATPDQEVPFLDELARRQDREPWLRFSTLDSRGSDPGDLTEAVGDADPVRSSRLGLMNVRRMVPLLLPAAEQRGQDYEDLEQLYARVVNQWGNLHRHVAAVVGGVESQEKVGGQAGVRFTPVTREKQREAMRFLNESAFRTPDFLLDEQVLRRIEPQGALDRVTSEQATVLRVLLADSRLARLVEAEALSPRAAYTAGDFLGDLRAGVWSELDGGAIRIDPFRRALQREYLEQFDQKLNPPSAGQQQGLAVLFGGGGPTAPSTARAAADAKVLMRGELEALDAELRAAIPRAADRATRMHLSGMRSEIEQILNPEG